MLTPHNIPTSPVNQKQKPPKALAALATAMQGPIWDLRRYWLGKVLTIVDAAIADQEQRKALKDLVNDAFYSEEWWSKQTADIAYQFAKKFAPDLMPRTRESEEQLFKMFGLSEGPPRGSQNWFSTDEVEGSSTEQTTAGPVKPEDRFPLA